MTVARSTRIASRRSRLGGALLALALALAAAPALAQTVLPRPAEPFTGKIGTTYADSTPAFPAPVTAPAGAPNVVLVLTDDVGFGAASTFGGAIPTPHLDRLAEEGLRFNRFHTTAMCSPTRAALLTGRNHHAVGNGIVANLTTGFPGYNNLMPKSAATIAEVLRQHGYNTAMFGKHHNAPEAHVSAAGPFDMWPTGLGFEYFYGFMAAETNQFTPALYRGITPVPTLEEGVLDKALADDAIHWLHQQQAAAPGKPFFMYYATGTAHAPLQAPADWIAKFRANSRVAMTGARGDVARQKSMGLVPRIPVNTPRPEDDPAWDASRRSRKRSTRASWKSMPRCSRTRTSRSGACSTRSSAWGERDNTLVIFIEGDNGAAAEGGMHGSMNPMSNFANGTQERRGDAARESRAIGGPEAVAQYGYGWTWATNAPFAWPSSMPRTSAARATAWWCRGRNASRRAALRTQFSHVIDIAPTILEATGVTAPDTVNGVDQQPIDGTAWSTPSTRRCARSATTRSTSR
jgi:arylsulfatase A-like enzyme